MTLPKRNDTNITGGLAVTIIQETIERKGWVFRRQDGDTDFGIDGEIEITDNNYVTGHICKCQVKGTKHIEWQNDSASVQVSVMGDVRAEIALAMHFMHERPPLKRELGAARTFFEFKRNVEEVLELINKGPVKKISLVRRH